MLDGKKSLFSGMQATGTITLGNYLGALKNWVELDSEEYHDGLAPLVHCFVEVKDNKIELPLVYKSCKQNVGKKVIYSLEEDSIKLIMDNVDDDKIFNYFKEEGIETIYIILDNFVELNSLAMKTLRLRNRDIVELCIDEEIFALIVK